MSFNIEFKEFKCSKIIMFCFTQHFFYYLGRGGYVNEALVEDDVSSRILYPPDPDPRLDRARSQLSAVSKVNIPGAVSYK